MKISQVESQVLRLPLNGRVTVADAVEFVPSGETVIEDLGVTRDTVWVVDMDGGPQTVDAIRLINAILLGDVTYDAVLLEVWPAGEGA